MATTPAVETYVVKGKQATIEKDTNEVLDYPFDWTNHLAKISDTIAASGFIVEPSLTVDARSGFDATHATVWLAGGDVPAAPLPNQLRVTNRITTVGGRVIERSIFIKIVER
ncbi:MAG: hypothetical protein EOP82_32635 [Variovorax sp.]|nr:MAG: hypothetical protein EOP82_32635 [Variovorax sp.]